MYVRLEALVVDAHHAGQHALASDYQPQIAAARAMDKFLEKKPFLFVQHLSHVDQLLARLDLDNAIALCARYLFEDHGVGELLLDLVGRQGKVEIQGLGHWHAQTHHKLHSGKLVAAHFDCRGWIEHQGAKHLQLRRGRRVKKTQRRVPGRKCEQTPTHVANHGEPIRINSGPHARHHAVRQPLWCAIVDDCLLSAACHDELEEVRRLELDLRMHAQTGASAHAGTRRGSARRARAQTARAPTCTLRWRPSW
jgi:hypothetical protein